MCRSAPRDSSQSAAEASQDIGGDQQGKGLGLVKMVSMKGHCFVSNICFYSEIRYERADFEIGGIQVYIFCSWLPFHSIQSSYFKFN